MRQVKRPLPLKKIESLCQASTIDSIQVHKLRVLKTTRNICRERRRSIKMQIHKSRLKSLRKWLLILKKDK